MKVSKGVMVVMRDQKVRGKGCHGFDERSKSRSECL